MSKSGLIPISVPLSENAVYQVTLNDATFVGTCEKVFGYVVGGYSLVVASADGSYSIRQNWSKTSYDVYYSDDLGKEEVSYVHGSVYTKPKVEPKQWRTKTTVGTTTTYGPWKLLSAETPTGTEGTDYEYMLETCVVREYYEPVAWCIVVRPDFGDTEKKFVIDIRKMAECTDQIHGDVISHFEAPEILENLNAYKHKDNENYTHNGSAGVVKTRRVKRGASNKIDYVTITHGTTEGAANWHQSATTATLGQGLTLKCGFDLGSSGSWAPGTGDNVSTMNGVAIPANAWTSISEAVPGAAGCYYNKKLTLTAVTGPIVIKGAMVEMDEVVPEKK